MRVAEGLELKRRPAPSLAAHNFSPNQASLLRITQPGAVCAPSRYRS